ncbi:MAG: GNAT family N-acetyltransferase [Actinobacteria bacterium]|nr:GNAT family N-acetyltransferase [Actinomycetota bacterium]
MAARGRPGTQDDSAADSPASAAADPEPTPVVVEPATPADLPRLIEVEVAADTLFEVAGYGTTPGPADLADLTAAELLLVARKGEEPVGYVRVELVDGQPHLESLSVRPRSMRQGIGSALVVAACGWAAEHGYRRITLCTFAEVPWNGPFYAQLGFAEVADPAPALRELRRHEAELGLDAMGRRCVMARDLRPVQPPDLPTG